MLNPPSVNQITSAYTGRMPQLSQRVEADKKAHGGIPQDLRALMAENDMAQAIEHAKGQAALSQPQNTPTVAQNIHDQIRQLTQKQPQAQPQADQNQGQPAPAGIPQGMPQGMPPQGLPQLQAKQDMNQQQGLNNLPTNVGQAYANGGIIGFSSGDEVPPAEEAAVPYDAATATRRSNYAPTAERIMNEAMSADPEAVLRAAEARRGGVKRDTSSMDEMIKEYRAEKERLAEPKPGLDAFMEYLGQIAAAPKGMGSLSAGAYGARQQKGLEESRAAQRLELNKQMLDLGQKKADIGYTQALETMGAGDAAKAAALKERYAAAIASTNNTLQQAKLAQELKLELAKLEVHKQQVAAMNKPPAFQQIYSELQSLHPEADKSKLFQQAVSMAGLSSRQESADAQMLDKLNDEIKQIDAAEAKLNFVKLTDPKQYALDKATLDKRRVDTETMRKQMYKRLSGQGLPDLNKANPESPTAAPGQPDYSKLWK